MFDSYEKFTDENGNELSFEELLSDASVRQANRLANDPEWSQKITIHIHSIISAFALGVLTSYPYYISFQMPPNFELVMNKMSLLIQKTFDVLTNECVEVSLLKLKGVYYRLAMSIPEYIAWNDITGNSFDITTTPTNPSFIDLSVPPHNAVIYLRNEERNYKRFDDELKKKYGDLK